VPRGRGADRRRPGRTRGALMANRVAGARRAEILRAAAELFAARGYHGVSIEDLGRAVGTSGPALYRHFPGKEALLGAMLLDISERLAAQGAERSEERRVGTAGRWAR